jgi:Putative Flp pilus-assembly TadE/G-like
MRPVSRRNRRRGSILPVLALLIVGLCGFTALSVEIATIAMVKVQCQNAADTSAMAGARALNGGTNSNLTASGAIALTAALSNFALGVNASNQVGMVNFKSTEFTYTPGTYHYNITSQTFNPAYTLQSGENYNLVKTTAQRQVKNAFFAVDAGTNGSAVTPTLVATAVAAHRPRDVAVVLDFSGSMNNESDLWNCESYLGSLQGLSNNSDPIVPTFGHYSSLASTIVSTSVFPGASSNMTQSTYGMAPLVNSYFATTATTTPSVPAFTAQPTSYGTLPQGDIPVNLNNTGSGNFATNPNDVFGTNYTTSIPKSTSTSTSAADAFENGSTKTSLNTASQGSNNLATAGYNYLYTQKVPTAPSGQNASGTKGFSGYTLGPAYYGKTFFQWPPDPRPTDDWRFLYFIDSNTSAGVTKNTTLWDSGGNWLTPSSSAGGYQVNYNAILNWIKNTGPNPFPSTLIAGGITYYSAIPTTIPSSAYNFANANSAITNSDQRFWKEYIDYCLGNWLDPFGNVQTPNNPTMSYGPDLAWGTTQITAKPTGTPPNGSKLAYMNYKDNPLRPTHRMWFGPMTMMQYIADTGINPGTARDISTFSTKLGIASILSDIQINHPNDQIAMVLYNRPTYANDPPNIGNFTQSFYGLNRNYSAMTTSLWYPPNYGTTTISPWDSNGSQVVNSYGDFCSNTTTQHGLMLAYNQFSSSNTLSALNTSTTSVGGLGRVGAKRLVILETDGMANNNTSTTFTSNGANSYWNILPGQTINSTGYDQTATLQVVQAICNNSNGTAGNVNSAVANPGYPGFATSNKSVEVQTIAFGIVFEINTSAQTNAVGLLQAISQIGGTVFPSSASDPTNGFKWCIGTLSQRVALLQQAFDNVMNDGNSISLVQ